MNPENRYFGSAAPNPEPAPRPTEPTPQPSVADLASSAKPEPKSKKPLIITIVIVVLIVIIGVVLTIILNQPKEQKEENNNQESAKEETPAKEIITEYKYEDRLAKSVYSIDTINSGFTYGKYAFAGTDEVKLRQAINETTHTDGSFSLLATNQNTEYIVEVAPVTEGTILTLSDACEQQENCDSDYIEGAKTLMTTTINSNSNTTYTFYSTIGNQLTSFSIIALKNDKSLNESLARSLLIKTAMTVSPSSKSDKPYIFDMAARIKLPFGKKVKSYEDIGEVTQDYFTITTSNESGATASISVRYQPLDEAKTTEVSSDPKIDSYKDGKFTYFRFYDNETPYDITVTTSSNKFVYVKDAKTAQEYINKIGE